MDRDLAGLIFSILLFLNNCSQIAIPKKLFQTSRFQFVSLKNLGTEVRQIFENNNLGTIFAHGSRHLVTVILEPQISVSNWESNIGTCIWDQ